MEKLFLIWLSGIRNCGSVLSSRLIKHFGSAEQIYKNKDINEFLQIEALPASVAQSLICDKDLNRAEKIMNMVEKGELNMLSLGEKGYPEQLAQIYSPPLILFYKGTNLFSNPGAFISIVGTRKASPYGISTAKAFAGELALSGVGTVSGLALGIDAAAHSACMENKGETVGVMGCGTNYVYPSSHLKLYDKVLSSGGMLLSEFMPDTPPAPSNFPRRNRIISALSLGTLVVEAALHSGSLITASYALEQGREVYAVPGNITSPLSVGCNTLIKEGAHLVLSANDILEDLFHLLRPASGIKEAQKQLESDKGELCSDEKLIYKCILSGSLKADEIANKLKKSISYVNSVLTMLEIKKKIYIKMGTLYII